MAIGRKTGGRVAGVPNKLSISRTVEEKLAALKCDPIEGMARLAADTHNTAELRGRMYAELARYIRPQLRAIELTGPSGGPIQFIDTLRSALQSAPDTP